MECKALEQNVDSPMPKDGVTDSEDDEEYEGDLNDDLHEALSEDYDFTGSYYHRSVEPNAPNPGLTIEGVGLIGLPLSDRDAMSIISRAAQAPFGKGEETIIDTTVRDTWEIEPTSVSFLNPKWVAFIDEIATKKVWTTLGVKPYTTKPQCELYKLLLYQTGSHFLPHQDTAKAKGMFATVIIVLPSAFEGGEVHVSHAGRSTVLDVSQGSFFNTSVLAWYTDVIHEVKPITSGYRLALSYNLIHTSNAPKPSLPITPPGAFETLRETLQRWKGGKYQISEELEFPLYAYMLSHQYSKDDLNRGMDALKGKDAYIVSLILPMVEEMNFVLCLANLQKTEVGYAEDHGGHHSYYKRRRWYSDCYSDEDETPVMGEVEENTLELSNVVRLSATGVLDLGLKDFEISEEALVPRDAFEDMSPDGHDYEGYQGNGAGSLSQWYRRSALVLYHKADETSILMSISGPSAVLRTLPLTETPTPAAQQVVATVLGKLSDSASAITIVNHAVLWKQHDIWNKAIPFVEPLETIRLSTSEALKVFGSELIQTGLSKLIQRQPGLQARLNITKTIATLLPGDDNATWLKDLAKYALSSYSAGLAADIPALVELSQEVEGGVSILSTVVIPTTATQPNAYDFHIALTEALDGQRKRLIDSQRDAAEIETFGDLTRQCLLVASSQWATPPPPPPSAAAYYHIRHNPTLSPTVLAERVNHLIKLCLSFENPELCLQIVKAVGVDRQMDVLNAVQSYVGDSRPTWVKELMQTVVSTYSTPAISHIPTLSWIAETLGSEHIQTLVSTKIPKSGTYEFLLALAKSLHERLSLISHAQDTTEETKSAFRTAVISCVLFAVPQWEAGLRTTAQHRAFNMVNVPTMTEPTVKVKRVLDLIEFILAIGEIHPLSALFTNLLYIQPNIDVPARFKELYTPLVPRLKATLTRHGKTLIHQPFKSFFKGIISLYLGRVLGVVPRTPYPMLPTSVIGCGCSECRRLTEWLSSSLPTIQFMAPQATRTHMEKQIMQAKITNLVTFTTTKGRTPYTLVVSKRPEIMSGLKWKEAQTAALQFVQVVGDNDQNLKEIMQDRYDDMIKSFSGTKSFLVGQLNISASTTSNAAGPSGSNNAPAAGGVAPVAGGKRKHRNPPTNVIDVIDLT